MWWLDELFGVIFWSSKFGILADCGVIYLIYGGSLSWCCIAKETGVLAG